MTLIFYNTNKIYSFLYDVSIGMLAGITAALFTIYISTIISRYNKTYYIPKSNLNGIINKIKNLKTRAHHKSNYTVFGDVDTKFQVYLNIVENEDQLRCNNIKSNIGNKMEPWLKSGTGKYPVFSIPSEEFDDTIKNIQMECHNVKPNWIKILFNIGK